MKTISVIAAHPDDEALGAGGSLLKAVKLGYEVHLLFITNGISSRTSLKKDLKIRHEGLKKAMNFLSPTSYKLLTYPDNKLDTISLLELTKKIESFLKSTRPDILLTHFNNDLNIDHRITCQASITACRSVGQFPVKKILSFEVPSSTDINLGTARFSPNYFIDISDCIDEKMAYLKYYNNEIRAYPHPRSYKNIYALSQLRGSEVLVNNAEGFILLSDLNYEF